MMIRMSGVKMTIATAQIYGLTRNMKLKLKLMTTGVVL